MAAWGSHNRNAQIRQQSCYEELPEASEAMITLAAIRVTVHGLAQPNLTRLSPP